MLADQKPARRYKLRAEAYAAKGDRKRAMADISRALKFTWNTDFLKVRGELRLDDGDIDGVMHDADAMLKLEPDNASAMALRGAAYARKKDYSRALADLDKAIKADDNNALGLWRARPDLSRARTTTSARSPISTAPSSSAPSAPRLIARAP